MWASHCLCGTLDNDLCPQCSLHSVCWGFWVPLCSGSSASWPPQPMARSLQPRFWVEEVSSICGQERSRVTLPGAAGCPRDLGHMGSCSRGPGWSGGLRPRLKGGRREEVLGLQPRAVGPEVEASSRASSQHPSESQNPSHPWGMPEWGDAHIPHTPCSWGSCGVVAECSAQRGVQPPLSSLLLELGQGT